MSRGANRPVIVTRRLVLAGGLATTAATLAACTDAQAPLDEEGRVRIRFATDTPAQAGHGGFYQALASGAYQRRGLTVEIVQGGPATNVPQMLASGTVELGLASSSFVPLTLVAEGAPVKAVAAFFQKDPEVLLAHPGPDPIALADLADRTVILPPASRATAWAWLKARHGFSDDQTQPYEGTPAPFLSDDRALQLGTLTADPYAIEQAGDIEPRLLLLADEGYPSYAAMVLSPDGFARDNAASLRSFIAASAEGWRDYTKGGPANPGVRAADALIRRANPQMTQPTLDQARARLNDYGIVDGGDAALYGLGTMTAERWRAFFDVTSDAGVYPPNLNWREAFTDDYLPGRG